MSYEIRVVFDPDAGHLVALWVQTRRRSFIGQAWHLPALCGNCPYEWGLAELGTVSASVGVRAVLDQNGVLLQHTIHSPIPL